MNKPDISRQARLDRRSIGYRLFETNAPEFVRGGFVPPERLKREDEYA